MAYTITTSLLNRLIALAKGAELSSSDCKGTIFNELVQEGLLITIPKGRGSCCKAPNGKALRVYLATRDDAFKDLEKTEAIYREISCSEDGTTPFAPRNIQASTTGNSKIRKARSCKGFLVNCYEPILVSLNEKKFEINPPEGSFVFIADYENFEIPQNVIVVGIENMKISATSNGKRNYSTIIWQAHPSKASLDRILCKAWRPSFIPDSARCRESHFKR